MRWVVAAPCELPARREATPVSTLDAFATITRLLDVAPPPDRRPTPPQLPLAEARPLFVQ